MSETLVKERSQLSEVNSDGRLVRTGDLAIAKLTTNEQHVAEERELQKVETTVERRYHGLRGYWRLFQISRVISMLSLYLYLDQYDIHYKHYLRRADVRLERARNLTRAA